MCIDGCTFIDEGDKSISEETMREGFRPLLRGRGVLKLNAADRTFIFDGAHNAAGAESFQL